MKISVALCTYNGEKFIEEQLKSILEQTVPITEIVIFDDGSSDTTVSKIGLVDQNNPGIIRLFQNKANVGFCKNFEKALTECNGDYIFFSDQDDVWHRDKVGKIISYLTETGKYGVFTNADLIDRDGNSIGTTLFDTFLVNNFLSSTHDYPELFAMLCFNENFVTGATLAIKKEGKNIVLPFRTSESIYHDHYIALKLSAIGKLGYMNDCLISYRIHPGQQTGMGKYIAERKCLYDIYYGCNLADKDSIDSLCDFIITRRIGTIDIIRTCCFNNNERVILTKWYTRLLLPLIFKLKLPRILKYLKWYIHIEWNVFQSRISY